MKDKHNPARIWIELPYPATEAERHEAAANGTEVLHRMGFNAGVEFKYCPDKEGVANSLRGRYILVLGPGAGYLTLTDHGHWFNLPPCPVR